MICSATLLWLVNSLLIWREAASYPSECVFPAHWRGTWFQYSVRQLIYISAKEVSSKGNCTEVSHQKYVVHNTRKRCYQCVVFYEKHINVLQYKESFCNRDSEPPDLAALCGHVTGDRQLYSMFRVDYQPIECPLRGPFTFTYSRGHVMQKECSRPRSRLERCNRGSRMLFRYQTCVDVAGAEEAEEEMECLGLWKEGSARFLVTRRLSPNIVSDEDRFRCFIYERAKPQEESWLDYRLAESAEATCSGLFSTSDGTRRLELRADGSYTKCQFPPWTTVHRHWHSLDRATSYQFNRKNTSLTVLGPQNETKMECAQIIDVSTREALLVARATSGCHGGYQCVAFYRRDGHVMEMQQGGVTDDAEGACDRTHFSRAGRHYHTIVASSSRQVSCPHLGQYSVTGVTLEERTRLDRDPEQRDLSSQVRDLFKSLHVGCQSDDVMVLSGGVESKAFACQGSWRENDTFYLVASPSGPLGTRRHFCFVYTASPEGLRFSTVRRTCPRALRPGVEGILAFNVTARVECLTGAGEMAGPAALLVIVFSAAAAARGR